MTEKLYPTPHINACPEDFARTVIMPGDPLRSKFIAANFLSEAKLVNSVRGISGFTGMYKGKRVSVMASGMGMPSMGIYSFELFNIFGVDNIIRAGSAGALRSDIKVRDIIFGMGACTNSAYASQYKLRGSFAPIASYNLLRLGTGIAEKMKLCSHVGNLLSSDTFYCDDELDNEEWAKMGVLAVEMETAALYMNAARAGKNALAVCTVSDNVVTGESLSHSDRETTFTQMMELTLEIAISA